MRIKLGFFLENSACGLYTGVLNRPKITVILEESVRKNMRKDFSIWYTQNIAVKH